MTEPRAIGERGNGMKTSELTGVALDWAVAKCEGKSPVLNRNPYGHIVIVADGESYSTDWAQGGPIIERERIRLDPREAQWQAQDWADFKSSYGPAPLIAAMRCYVASKLGDEVEIPEELA